MWPGIRGHFAGFQPGQEQQEPEFVQVRWGSSLYELSCREGGEFMDVRTLLDKAVIFIGRSTWSFYNEIQTVSMPETLGAEAESGSDL